MNKLISEQVVIDRLSHWYSDMLETGKEQEDLIEVIKAIPPAEPDWIPVSERSPEKSGDYWCTFGGTNLTGSDFYTTESDAKEIFDEPEEYAGWRSQNVIAWMPLPKRYEPRESEG